MPQQDLEPRKQLLGLRTLHRSLCARPVLGTQITHGSPCARPVRPSAVRPLICREERESLRIGLLFSLGRRAGVVRRGSGLGSLSLSLSLSRPSHLYHHCNLWRGQTALSFPSFPSFSLSCNVICPFLALTEIGFPPNGRTNGRKEA